MKRRSLLQLIALALAGMSASARADDASRNGEFDHGLLWRVKRPGVTASHLFGTVHLDDPRALDFKPAVRRALNGARVLMLELIEDGASAQRFAQASRLQGGTDLRDLAGTTTADRVAAVLGSRYGMPPAMALRLQPWAAYLALGQPPATQGEIVDAALRRVARQQGVAVRALETVEEQIASLEAVPQASMLALLDALARRHDEAQGAIGRLRELYLAGDLAGLWRLQQASIAGEPALQGPMDDLIDHMLRRRNARMVERLLPELQAGRAMAAMGALHLYGTDGIPARLQAAGWRVRRVDDLTRPSRSMLDGSSVQA